MGLARLRAHRGWGMCWTVNLPMVVMNEVQQTLDVAKGISEYGIMIIICAVFLVLASALMIACFKWFKSSISKLLSSLTELSDLNDQLREMNLVIRPIAERFLPETRLRIENISEVFFELAVEKVCRIIKKIREENHIANREATKAKIRTLLHNLYEDRNSRFDSFRYRGKTLSEYSNPEWVEWVAKVVEGELYNETGANNGRAYTNVKAVYENIKLDFYHRMTNQ